MQAAKNVSRENWSVAVVLAIGASLLTNHIQEIVAQAEAYLEELRNATAAIQERLRAGLVRLKKQTHEDEPMPDASAMVPPGEPEEAAPAPPSAGLVSFDDEEA